MIPKKGSLFSQIEATNAHLVTVPCNAFADYWGLWILQFSNNSFVAICKNSHGARINILPGTYCSNTYLVVQLSGNEYYLTFTQCKCANCSYRTVLINSYFSSAGLLWSYAVSRYVFDILGLFFYFLTLFGSVTPWSC